MAQRKRGRPVEVAAAAAARPVFRREGDREVPIGPKAQRTRAALLRAAYDLFTENGYLDTSVADITRAAGVSLGTFYQYFRDRAEVVGTLLYEHAARNLSTTQRAWDPAAGWDGVYAVVHSFVQWYAEEAALAKVWEEVSHIDERGAELRRDLGRMFTETVQHQLVAGVEAGLVDMDAGDADLAARALTGMVDRFCYVTYVFDPPKDGAPMPEDAARVLTDLWSG